MAKIKNWRRTSKDESSTTWRHDETNDLVMVKKVKGNSIGELLATKPDEEDALRKNWILQTPTWSIPNSNTQRTGFKTREKARKAAIKWMRNHTNLVEIRAKSNPHYKKQLKENDPEKYREIFR